MLFYVGLFTPTKLYPRVTEGNRVRSNVAVGRCRTPAHTYTRTHALETETHSTGDPSPSRGGPASKPVRGLPREARSGSASAYPGTQITFLLWFVVLLVLPVKNVLLVRKPLHSRFEKSKKTVIIVR